MRKRIILPVILAGGLVLMLVFSLVIGAILKTPQEQRTENLTIQEKPETFNDDLSVQIEENLPEEVQVVDEIDTSDWQTYRNEEYGFEVRYPEGFGEIFIHLEDGFDLDNNIISGKKISGKFSNNPNIEFGGITTDYRNSRSVYSMDFSGYKEKNGQYFFMSVDDFSFLIDPIMIIKKNILLIDCNSFEEKCDIQGPSVALYKDQIRRAIKFK